MLARRIVKKVFLYSYSYLTPYSSTWHLTVLPDNLQFYLTPYCSTWHLTALPDTLQFYLTIYSSTWHLTYVPDTLLLYLTPYCSTWHLTLLPDTFHIVLHLAKSTTATLGFSHQALPIACLSTKCCKPTTINYPSDSHRSLLNCTKSSNYTQNYA